MALLDPTALLWTKPTFLCVPELRK
nr:unnamed protein product [Callosobruchus analis]